MKRIITKILIFCLPIILVGISAEILLRNIPNDYEYKAKYLTNNSDEIKIIVLGSSNTYYGVDPQYFTENSFNVAYISQSLYYDYKILKKYNGDWKSLEYIILTVSSVTMCSNLEDTREAWRVKNYNIYWKFFSSSNMKDYFEIFSNNYKINNKRLKSYYIDKHSNITSSKLGWGTEYKSTIKNDLVEAGKVAALRHSANADKSHFIANREIVNDIINFAAYRNIKVVLLTTPVYHTYLENIDKEQMQLTINTCEQMDIANENVIYVNSLSDEDFVEKDFYDADHLNEIGAKKLSQKLDSIINNWK